MSPSSSSGKPDVRPAVRAVLSLGSNLGERERHLLSAASRISSAAGIVSARLSSLYLTDPQGDGYSRAFVNAVMVVETMLSPRELLAMSLGFERDSGRVRGGEKGDRTLDIDIILYGDAYVDESDLRIPHPRFMKRLFVLVPLAELEPGYPLPGGVTASQAADSPEAEGGVIKISSRSRISRKSL
jgi:2-amino-4-hydroxy-6-hydroxymethyldihydropteridine diphosphokinase